MKNKVEHVMLWNRELELQVQFDCYEGEEILSSQREALQKILTNPDVLNRSEEEVRKYCLKQNPEEIGEHKIEDLFKYVIPQTIYIPRMEDGSRVVALLCAYKFDMDNGIAVVFKNENYFMTGTQNIIL